MVELAAGVEDGHHDLGRADAAFGVHADGDAAAVVLDRDRAVEVDGDAGCSVQCAGEVLVDGVVDGLPHEVVQPRAVVHVADVHAGALAHGLEALEHRDAVLVVALGERFAVERWRSWCRSSVS